jgi:hypothetical protein
MGSVKCHRHREERAQSLAAVRSVMEITP